MTAPERPDMGTREIITLVAERELGQRLRARSFAVVTIALVVIILIPGVVSRFIEAGGPTETRIGLTGDVPQGLAAALVASGEASDRQVTTTPVDSADAARSLLEDGQLDVAVLGAQHRVVFAGEVDQEVLALIRGAWSAARIGDALQEHGVGEQEARQILAAEPLQGASLKGASLTDDDGSGVAVLAGTLAAILLFLSLQTSGGYVLVGVVEEKSTAVLELLLARARPDQLLAGKVVGIGVAALLQFVLAVIAGLVSLAISGAEVPSDVWPALPMTVVWFLGGYAFYSMLFALAGSLVSRQEDAQAAAAPIMTALIGAYVLIFVLGHTPESTASTVLSLVPPIAPLLMPMRMAAGAASPLEVVTALVLLAAATYAVWKLAGRIYEQVLLRRGSRISWKDAVSLLRRS